MHADEIAAMSHYDNDDHPMNTEEAWLNLAIIADLGNGRRDIDQEDCESLATDEQGRGAGAQPGSTGFFIHAFDV
ncbi:hypothetical protein DL765_001642 [Monosporascus sp. GIB2]|nr:hypothetical protein DL765_001642 [Monosporascus sp. GIB2]